MAEHSFVIRRLGIASLARWGFVAGALVACAPAFACSVLLFSLTGALNRIVQTWRDVGVTLLGQRFGLDFLSLLHLQGFANALHGVDALGISGILLLWFGLALALGFFAAAVLVLLGWLYNLTGRLRIELEEK